MTYRKLKDGAYAVGFNVDGRFIAHTSAFDAREAKALVKAIHAVIDLFHTTSGAWVTLLPDGTEIPRGSTRKKETRERRKRSSKD
jgi:hypothetical protein